MSLEQLSEASSDIISGRVMAQKSDWNPSHTQIFTVTRISVEQRVKGQAPELIDIQQPGGKVGNLRVYVPGTVHFRPAAKYLLFLEPSKVAPAQYLLVGMAQGAYRFYKDASTGEERVIRPLGARFYSSGASAAQTTSMKEFRQALSSAMQTPMVIPSGTGMSVRVQQSEMNGAGRIQVVGLTASDVFPTSSVVVPAGSVLQGEEERQAGAWRIHWSEVMIRGVRVRISATSELARSEVLRGRTVVARVQ